MRIVDLTHVITSSMPVYPGTAAPRLSADTTIERDGFRETRLDLASHTGTHMDAPAHLLAEGATLDRLPVSRFVGPAVVMNATGPVIERAALAAFEEELRRASFLIVRTGWSRHWGTPAYFAGFPVLSADAARLAASCGISGVGIDAISVDPVGDPALPVHRILLGAGLVIVENLTGIEALPSAGFTFQALPLAFADADGAPVRAVALLFE